ncbi:hypothetical protein FOC1_g10016027 [Fusarium oxysporum f. sp. cubense race 1]|uniref:Uncharacterized protein n=1 Tax=Fusarium oxysporum f. sp. cubense (strain race 1) TaxID=1229664 RepID=N4TX97_FUSC1|nr:hypothetical protein FOC1_g10016027 [Fusarium oxysporum f. sp. cubense race 1]
MSPDAAGGVIDTRVWGTGQSTSLSGALCARLHCADDDKTSWIRYHDANKSLVWKPNTEAVNATTSERAAIIGSMGSRILSTQLSPSSLAYCTWAEA